MKKIKVNDNVLITTGKDKGKKGKVQQVFPKKGKLLIEGLNIYKKHMKAQSETQQAGIIDKEMFVDISNVALIDPNNNEPTKVGISELKEEKFCDLGDLIDLKYNNEKNIDTAINSLRAKFGDNIIERGKNYAKHRRKSKKT